MRETLLATVGEDSAADSIKEEIRKEDVVNAAEAMAIAELEREEREAKINADA